MWGFYIYNIYGQIEVRLTPRLDQKASYSLVSVFQNVFEVFQTHRFWPIFGNYPLVYTLLFGKDRSILGFYFYFIYGEIRVWLTPRLDQKASYSFVLLFQEVFGNFSKPPILADFWQFSLSIHLTFWQKSVDFGVLFLFYSWTNRGPINPPIGSKGFL